MLRFLLFLALASCSRSVSQPAPAADPPAVDPHAAAVGVWRIPPASRSRSGPGVVEMPSVVRFYFDGTHVTLSLLTEKAWMWRRPDDTYRLDARWVGDDLQYRPPFGKWTLLATLRAGHFEEPGTTAPWTFERVTPAMMDAQDRALLAPRPAHDYSIKPTDRYQP